MGLCLRAGRYQEPGRKRASRARERVGESEERSPSPKNGAPREIRARLRDTFLPGLLRSFDRAIPPGVRSSALPSGSRGRRPREPSRGQKPHARLCHFARTNEPRPCGNAGLGSLVSGVAFAYADVMYATAVVGGKVVRFKLSPALARAHRQNRGKSMTEAGAVAFVETKRRARALRRARPYLASRP